MDFLNNAYNTKVIENDKNVQFWEDYLQNLKSLDLSIYNDKLKVPVLVPIGSRIFFRGEIKHTNEVTVALGADYFTKCSLKQAEALRQHRIRDAELKLNLFKEEKEYLENQILFSKENVFRAGGEEIIEVYNEKEEKFWKEKHRENVKKYMQNRSKEEETKEEISDDELWNRLEELELQEELKDELSNINNNQDSYVDTLKLEEKEEPLIITEENLKSALKIQNPIEKIQNKVMLTQTNKMPHSQIQLLHQVINKQNELENKLLELKNKERSQSKTENDLILRLEEMEELDELEDEMDRLDDMLDDEDVSIVEEVSSNLIHDENTKSKKSVSFAEVDDNETIVLTFKHSEVEPSDKPYDPEKGIEKPSDIYKAFSSLFGEETVSILKNSKYKNVNIQETKEIIHKHSNIRLPKSDDSIIDQIVVRDVVEKVDQNDIKLENIGARPTSLFKKKRMQNKCL